MTALAALLAAVIGLTLGLLGGGGSILTVPVFVYVLGFGAKEAIAMSLGVVGAVSLFGAAGHWRAGNVDLRAAVAFGVFAMAGTFGGARLSALFSGAAQLAIFAVVMLAAAVFMFRGRRGGEDDTGARRMRLLPTAAVGIGVGVLTGLVGVGGGFMIVPALVLLARVPMRRAVGTSLLVISMNAATGFAGYLGQVEVAWGFMAAFAAVAVAGILTGSWLVRFVPQRTLRRVFAAFLLVMGTAILWQNRSAVVPGAHAEPTESAGARPADPTTTGATMEPMRSVDRVTPGMANASQPLPDVATAGQPTESEIRSLADAGWRTVIDLRLPGEPRGFDEPAVVRDAGMEYVAVPVGPEATDEAFDAVRALLSDEARRPVLFHCASANRVGALLIPTLVLDRGVGEEAALETAVRVGLRSEALARQALDYVGRHRGADTT